VTAVTGASPRPRRPASTRASIDAARVRELKRFAMALKIGRASVYRVLNTA